VNDHIIILKITHRYNNFFFKKKIVKTRFRNKIEDNFLANSVALYIEKKIAERFDLYLILDNFVLLRDRKMHL
jgi:hypothetical protein